MFGFAFDDFLGISKKAGVLLSENKYTYMRQIADLKTLLQEERQNQTDLEQQEKNVQADLEREKVTAAALNLKLKVVFLVLNVIRCQMKRNYWMNLHQSIMKRMPCCKIELNYTRSTLRFEQQFKLNNLLFQRLKKVVAVDPIK